MALSDAAKSEIDRLIRTASGGSRGATAGDYAAWGATQADGRSYYDTAKSSKSSWDSTGIADEIYASPEFAPQSGYDPTKIAMHQDGNAKRTALALDFQGLAPQGQVDVAGVANQAVTDIHAGQTAAYERDNAYRTDRAWNGQSSHLVNGVQVIPTHPDYDADAAAPYMEGINRSREALAPERIEIPHATLQDAQNRYVGLSGARTLSMGSSTRDLSNLTPGQAQGAQNGAGVQQISGPNRSDSVQGNVADVVRADGPLMDLARMSAAQAANSRGMLNSSMAQRAAQDAVLNVALPIGSQQAGQNFESNENYRNYLYSDSLQDQSIAANERMHAAGISSSERMQQEDIRFQSAEASIDRALQEQLATWNLNATESDNAARQVYSAQSAYETALANINVNTNLAAEDRETQIGLARDRFDDAMQLVEQIYNIDLTWGDVAEDAEQAAA